MARDPRSMTAARRLFEDFSGREPAALDLIELPADKVLLAVGPVAAIEYYAERDGERALYRHKFKASARPVLASSHDGRQLYLLAGAYRFTDRGIVDH